jgi:hypothetical protein
VTEILRIERYDAAEDRYELKTLYRREPS